MRERAGGLRREHVPKRRKGSRSGERTLQEGDETLATEDNQTIYSTSEARVCIETGREFTATLQPYIAFQLNRFLVKICLRLKTTVGECVCGC